MSKRYCLTMVVKVIVEAEDEFEACQNISRELKYDSQVENYQIKKVEEREY